MPGQQLGQSIPHVGFVVDYQDLEHDDGMD
jgi:hypothetical protein